MLVLEPLTKVLEGLSVLVCTRSDIEAWSPCSINSFDNYVILLLEQDKRSLVPVLAFLATS